MLKELSIKNVAIIDQVHIDFNNGFSALTGETGAGKSILIDSINMVLGGRANSDLIRTGAEKAQVDALFDVENRDILNALSEIGVETDDGSVVINRALGLDGKSSCRVNGRITPVSLLKEIGALLINIHGQHDNQTLLTPSSHIKLLDLYGGLSDLRDGEYAPLFHEASALEAKISELTTDEAERERRLDMLNFQIDEIGVAKLREEEEEELSERRKYLSNIEKISGRLEYARQALYGGEGGDACVHDLLSLSVDKLGEICEFDPQIKELHQRISCLAAELDDVSHELGNYAQGDDFDPTEIEHIEERLDIIYRLKRKYGNSIADILAYYDNACAEAEALSGSAETLEALEAQLSVLREKLAQYAQKLHEARVKAAKKLSAEITSELAELDMKKVEFKVEISVNTNADGSPHYSSNGTDKVEFLISANTGESLKPLSKIASGGEMSRIMLAIKSILAEADNVPTMIFDEIDTGVSGRAAQKIAEKISKLSQGRQIICVTHLAQLAGMADSHFLIEKHTSGGKTATNVRLLDRESRISELARIIGGAKITDLTLKTAKEMIELADAVKK